MQIAQTFPSKYLLTTAHFHQMAATNILAEHEHVELIEGELFAMAPIGSEHSGKTRRLNKMFSQLVGQLALVDVQNPIILGEYSEPQPDVVLLKPREDFYEQTTPQAEDVLLVIEIADSTLKYDQQVKIPLYAHYGIPEVWLINIPQQRLEIYLHPTPTGYQQISYPQLEDKISPLLLPGMVIEVARLWR
jgi:Uma2 family endonuclease